uniref:Adenosine deaminase n=1 Tax=Timema tahoe TaxID=61484 RepID=A0A7R9IAQ0_9NEOP|nr:unnamed protein product [Timema tahoe]
MIRDVLRLCEHFRDEGVVGLDTAAMSTSDLSEYEEVSLGVDEVLVYQEASRLGIHRTVHAGEIGSAEMVKRAVEEYNSERIGHGYNVLSDPAVYDMCQKKDIHFETCPWSSLLTGAVPLGVNKHPIVRFAEDNLNFSLSSDDPTVTGCFVEEDYRLAASWGLSEAHFVRCVVYYSVDIFAEKLSDIVTAMQPHFSSQPGTYYSDALFFISMGLHRIALDQNRVAMFDVDTKLRADVGQLFQEFDSFEESTLFGLAPELTPVYRHVLYVYRSKHKGTKFGEPISKGGFPGVNSGVMLLRLDRMRESVTYNQLLKSTVVEKLASKYQFKGHLGDQDFYTLLGMEHPELIHVLPCTWNRQLCTWWRDHGYQDVFKDFFRCQGPVRLYHGNCNTPIPSD